MRIYATEQLGPKQSLTPEGYLLCEAVPIARTGSQLYAAHELPFLESGLDGLITVIREGSEVFRSVTMASFEGKSVTIGHNFVDPDSWGELTKGTVQNVRIGDGPESDLLIADLLITDAEAIEAVRVKLDDAGRPVPGQDVLREVSCGYEADYVQDRPGVAFQRNIVGNHVALVPRGRAGPRCSIQDEEVEIMTTANTTGLSLMQRLLRALKTGDSALIKRTADEAEKELTAEEKKAADEEAEKEKKETADAIAALVSTVGTLAKTVDALAKGKKAGDEIGPNEGDQSKAAKLDDKGNPIGDDELSEEEKKKAADAEAETEKKETADAMRDTASRAEILVPGFSMPTTDSIKTRDAVTVLQRKVLVDAIKTEDGKALIVPLLSGRTVDALDAVGVRTVFVAASMLMGQQNNARGVRRGVSTKDFGTVVTPAEINRRNAEFWNKQS